jgi:O-antigen ligase
MVRARPILGFGLGTFEIAYPAYALRDVGAIVNHAHNDWVEWAADGGIPFSLAMAAVAVWCGVKATSRPWALGIVSVFLHSLIDFPLQNPVIALWLFTLIGVLTADPVSNPAKRSLLARRLAWTES